MRFAYADPPYLGCCQLYGHRHEPHCWNQLATHAELIQRLKQDFPDGWALSSSVPGYRRLERAGLIPEPARIAVWHKPFAIFKPGVNPAYTWEPVIFMGGRKRDRAEPTIRDFLAANITLKKGLTGAKPARFNEWVLDLLGYEEGDEMVDLFPGTGGMGAVLAQRRLVYGD